ncbi:MAG: hypothetical protein KDA61_23185, partial [Planctomycetales bacterium]|nr:hypothetical protein [Planctomycetales bacterium]
QDLEAARAKPDAPGRFAWPKEPLGNQSAIGASLEEAIARESQQRLMAVLLLSDGAQRAFAPLDLPPQTAVQRLALDGTPLFAFTFGKPSLGRQADVRISDLVVSDSTFVDTPVKVDCVLASNGFANRSVRVQLLWEDVKGEMPPVAAQVVELTNGKQRHALSLEHTPTVPGEFKLTVRAESPDGELITSNNEQSSFITVRKGGVKILYLAGSARIGGGPSFEPRFVRKSLAAHADFHVDYELINYARDEVDYRDRLRGAGYDVFLIGDVDVKGLTQRTWREIATQVERGAGLAMLGGFHSFGPGGFRGTQIESALPIEMGRVERQNFGEPIREDMHLPAPVKFMPIERNGRVHPILQLADGNDNLELWRKMPSLNGANRLDPLRLKPNAERIAQADDASRHPLLVLGGWGDGRTAAFAVDSTWLWQLGGYGEEHRRFWRQFVLWLAKKELDDEEQAWIRLDQRRYQQGSRVEFAVGSASDGDESGQRVEYEVRVDKPDGASAVVATVQRGERRVGAFSDTALGGVYTVRVVARRAGQVIGEAAARLAVSD